MAFFASSPVVGMLFIVGIVSRGPDARSRSHLYLRQRHCLRIGCRLRPLFVLLALSRGLRLERALLVELLFASLAILVLLLWHNSACSRCLYRESEWRNAGRRRWPDHHAPWNLFTMPLDSWLWLIAAALITGFGAFYLLTHATKRLKAGELAAISYQETIMASLLGLCLFGETLTAFQLIGGALIVIGGVSRSSSPPVRRTKKSTMPLLMAKWPWRPKWEPAVRASSMRTRMEWIRSWLLWPTAPRKLPTLTIGIIPTPTTAKSPAFAEGLAGEVRVRPPLTHLPNGSFGKEGPAFKE